MNEGELLQAAQRGDRAALDRLLTQVEPSVYRFGMRMCRDPQDAEDVLQETLLAMARHIDSFRGDSSLSTWAFTIARNQCRRRRKKEASQGVAVEVSELERVADESPTADEVSSQNESWEQVAAALRLIGEDYREIIVLRDVEGVSANEAARVLQLSIPAVKSRLHRARKALRQALGTIEAFPDCPDIVDAFSRNLEGELSSQACAKMESHIAACPRCHSLCNALKRDLRLCQMAPEETVPVEISERIRKNLHGILRI